MNNFMAAYVIGMVFAYAFCVYDMRRLYQGIDMRVVLSAALIFCVIWPVALPFVLCTIIIFKN
jgi:hypothetical protein